MSGLFVLKPNLVICAVGLIENNIKKKKKKHCFMEGAELYFFVISLLCSVKFKSSDEMISTPVFSLMNLVFSIYRARIKSTLLLSV